MLGVIVDYGSRAFAMLCGFSMIYDGGMCFDVHKVTSGEKVMLRSVGSLLIL